MKRVRNDEDDERVERVLMPRVEGDPRLIHDNLQETRSRGLQDLIMSCFTEFAREGMRDGLRHHRDAFLESQFGRRRDTSRRIEHAVYLRHLLPAILYEKTGRSYINQLSRYSINEIVFHGAGQDYPATAELKKRIMRHVLAGRWNAQDVAGPLAPFAEALGNISSLDTIKFKDFPLAFAPFVGAIIRACRQVKKVAFELGEKPSDDENPFDRYMFYLSIQQALKNNPSIEELTVWWGPWFNVIGRANLPNLNMCSLQSSGHISRRADAEALSSLLSSPKMIKCDFNFFHFEDLRHVGVVCQALAVSRLKTLNIFGGSFPRGSEEILMGAIGQSELDTLHIAHLPDSSSPTTLWMTGLSLALQRCRTMRTVCLVGLLIVDGDAVIALLQHSAHWKVETMALTLAEWNEEIEEAVADYVRTNAHLWKLYLVLPRDETVFASERILDAVDAGGSLLEKVTIEGRLVDLNWRDRLQVSIEWNRSFKLAQAIIGGHFI